MERQKLDLDDLNAFFLVAETGSFGRAAQRLNSSKSIISRRITRLETGLSARLLQRSVRGTHLTEVGKTYYDEARAALTQLECAGENLVDSEKDISGPIRITGPAYFGTEYLAPALSEFMQHYPRIELDVNFNDEKEDLLKEGYDLAIRMGALITDSSLTVRKLCQSRMVVVASPAYLQTCGRIQTPEDLQSQTLLHYNGVNTHDLWRYYADGKEIYLKVAPTFRSNSAAMLMTAARAGVGLTLLPVYITGGAIQSGAVELVLKDTDWGSASVNIVMPYGRHTTKRVRSLINFLVLKFQNRFA